MYKGKLIPVDNILRNELELLVVQTKQEFIKRARHHNVPHDIIIKFEGFNYNLESTIQYLEKHIEPSFRKEFVCKNVINHMRFPELNQPSTGIAGCQKK